MPIYTNNNQGNIPGNNSLSSFSSFNSLPSFNSSSTTDLTPDELLAIAKSSGGAIGQVASELTNPHTSILSTIDQGLKSAFHGFINTISLTGETVAGTIDSIQNGTPLKDSIKNAIDTKKRISDAIFGSKTIDFNGDGNKTTMEKVGDFIVRTSFDILLDPLTYLTFGASAEATFLERAGLSLASNSKVSLTKGVAEQFGIKLGEGEVISKSLNDLGQQVFGYTKKIVAQKTGKIAADNMIAHGIETGALKQSLLDQGVSKEIIDTVENTAKGVVNQNRKNIELGLLKNNVDLTGKELSILIKNTMELPVNVDLAKKTISSLLDKNPALAKTIIDQGGIKYFGKTLLSAQRISQIKSMIPGMTKLDELTLPLRNSLLAPFDTGLKKINGVYTRIPEEFAKVQQGFKDLTQARKVDFANNMQNIKDVYKLNSNDVNILMDAVHTSKMPADIRLGKAYSDLTGILEKDRQMFESLGIPKAKLDMYTGNVLLTNNEGKIARNGNFRQVPGTAEYASYAKLIEQSNFPILQTNPSLLDETQKLLPQQFKDLSLLKSPQELASAIGKQVDNKINELMKKNKKLTFNQAIQDSEVQKIVALRDKIDLLDKNKETIGKLEKMGFIENKTVDVQKSIVNEYTTQYEKLGITRAIIEKSISDLAQHIKDISHEIVSGKAVGIATGLGLKDKTNQILIAKRIEDFVGSSNVDKLLKQHQSEKDIASIAQEVAKTNNLKKTDAQAIISQALKEYNNLHVNIDDINKEISLFNAARETKKPSVTTAEEKQVAQKFTPDELKQIAQIYAKKQAAKFGIVRGNLDEKALGSMVEALQKEYDSNPIGVRRMLGSILNNKGKLDEVIANMRNVSFEAEKKLAEVSDLASYWTNNEGRIHKRVAVTASQLADAGIEGFDTNLLTSFVFRGMKNISQLTAHEFMGSMIRDFGKWSNEAPPSWVTLASTAVDEKTKFLAKQLFNDAGQEMKFHPAIAEAVDGMMQGMAKGDEITSKVFENYDKILKYWKASMTSIFPMFHGRNAISNVFQNFLDLGAQALNPVTHFSAINLMADNSNMNRLIEKSLGTGEEAIKASQDLNTLLGKTVFKDNSGYNWSFGELQKIVKDNNIAFNKNNLGYMDIADREKLLTNLFEKETKFGQAKNFAQSVNPLSTEKFFGFKAGKWLGGGIEDQARLVNFMTNLKATGDVAHSAARTKMFLFDYGNLTSFERSFMRRVIPFYTWTRKNLELQYKTFTSQPGRVAAEVKTIMNLGSIFDGQQLTEAEQKLVPEWLKNSLNLKVKNKNGADQLLSGFSTPVEQAFQQFTSNQILGGISPLIRFPLEKMTGYQFFRGKPTSQVIDASNYKYAPQSLKDFIGYSEYRGVTKSGKKYDVSVSLRPERMMTLQNLPFSRVITTLGNISDQTKSVGMKTIENLTGVKTMSFNEQLLEQKQQDTLRIALENVLTNAGVRGQFIRYYTKKNTTQLQ